MKRSFEVVEEGFVQGAPLVSVSVTTYQHAPFLDSCLDSILAQRCDFAYEVLLGEDESTDGTREIAQRYAAAHPDRIRLFLHRREQMIRIDGRPTGRHNFLNNLRQARGRYLCHLDGDDAWTDPDRLRIMVEKMEAEPDLGLAFHNAMNVWPDGREEPYLDPEMGKPRFSRRELTARNFIPTSGVIWRWNGLKEFPKAFREAPFGDWALNVHFAGLGPIGFVDRILSVRRVHDTSVMAVMDEVRTLRATALAYEVMEEQVHGDLTPGALKRWERLVREGFDRALSDGNREYASWFIRHAGKVQGAPISSREKRRWWALLHFPKLMGAYSRLRGASPATG